MLRKTINCLLPLQLIAVLLLFFSTSCNKMKEEASSDDSELDKPVSMAGAPAVQAPVTIDQATQAAFYGGTWMSKVPDKVKISHLSIPGTRNSKMSDYQIWSVQNQFNHGVRYFHLKVADDPLSTLVSVLSTPDNSRPELNSDFTNFSLSLKHFLTGYSTEAVVVLIEPWGDPASYPTILKKLKWWIDREPDLFYKWPNFFNGTGATTTDWPELGARGTPSALRGKIMMLSSSDHFRHQDFIRVVGPSSMTLGFANTPGVPQVTANLAYQHSTTTGEAKWDAIRANIINADMKTDVAAAATLYLNETGADVAPTQIQANANFTNARLEDVFELQYNENPSSGRFGIIAVDKLDKYLSTLIYLTNFNWRTKLFKSNLMGGYSGYAYNADGTIANYPITQLTGTYYTNFPSEIAIQDGTPFDYFVTPRKWMQHIPDNTPLSAINLPGTHDAATSTGTTSARCQSWTIEQQLNGGVRVLDIRLMPTIDRDLTSLKLVAHHTEIYFDITCRSILETVVNFLNTNPSETVVLNVSLDDGATSPGTAISMFKNEVPNYLDYFWGGAASHGPSPVTWPTMGELRGKMFLMAQDANDITWRDLGINIRYGSSAKAWYDGYPNWFLSVKSGGGADNYNDGLLDDRVWDRKWNDIKSHLDAASQDANIQTLYNTGSSYTYPNPVTAADGINPRIRSWIKLRLYNGNPTPSRYGILSVDFSNYWLVRYYLTNFSAIQFLNP